MVINALWIVDLPIRFTVGDHFKKTELSIFSFVINDVNIELLKNNEEKILDKVKISLSVDYDDDYLPFIDNVEYYSSFIKQITIKVGSAIQGVLDGFSKATTDEYYQIFDGEDFITPCKFYFLSSSESTNNGVSTYYLDDDKLMESIEFAGKRKNALDNAWYLIRDSEHSMDLGKYEISLIYMAISVELLVTSALTDYLNEKGKFTGEHKRSIELLYGTCPKFVDKYFNYGISLITSKKLPEKTLEMVDFIYTLRNRIAHGKLLYEIDLMVENNIDIHNIRDYWFSFIQCVTEVYNYFFELNKEISLYDR